MATTERPGPIQLTRAAARGELQTLEEREPEVAVYGLEVTANRELSDYVAERLGVAHESPQVFVLRDGTPVSRAEHYEISARGLQRALAHPRDAG
jgi:bacillithiol system protein YtxJ